VKGFNPFSTDDSFYVCAVPTTYQTLIIGGFLAAFGHMINDAVYGFYKKAELSLLTQTANSPLSDTVSNAFMSSDEQATTWHTNIQASLETIALASNTGLIAALSAPDWGVEGQVIDYMRAIVQVTIMANYLIQGITAISPLLSILLLVWSYIFNLEQIWGWSVCIWNWTFGLVWWVITWVWARLCCIEAIVTCQCCASKGQYESVPAHDAL
jgi:hypothetical protein